MKRIYILCLLCLVSSLVMSCGKHENVTNSNKTSSSTMDNIPKEIPTVSSDTHLEGEHFVGEYNDVDCDEPNLEIKKIEDGTYEVEIGIFRLYYIPPCEGKLIDDKIEFFSERMGGLRGIITEENDVATVTFLSNSWKKVSSTNTYKYYKTSDKPYDKGSEFNYQ